MSAYVEMPEWINERTVEKAYSRAVAMTKTSTPYARQSFCEKGMRAARDRAPVLMKALEGGAEVLQKMTERQMGRTQRDPGTCYAHTLDPCEYSLWREAFIAADKGTPIPHLALIYGAAAELAGL
jgi:hypothetical protein